MFLGLIIAANLEFFFDSIGLKKSWRLFVFQANRVVVRFCQRRSSKTIGRIWLAHRQHANRGCYKAKEKGKLFSFLFLCKLARSFILGVKVRAPFLFLFVFSSFFFFFLLLISKKNIKHPTSCAKDPLSLARSTSLGYR